MIRDTIKTDLVTAMKGGDKATTSTIRLIQSAIKNRDIELRTATQPTPDDDALVIDVLQKMAKQRRESITMFQQGGRDELAARPRLGDNRTTAQAASAGQHAGGHGGSDRGRAAERRSLR